MYDSVIVGAGPAGMSAALYLVRFGRNIALVESMTPGGQVLLTSEVENIPSIKEIKGYELADSMKAQLDAYSYDYITEQVTSIEKTSSHFILHTANGKTLLAKTVIIASGARYKRAGIPNEVEFTGKGISYCALCDGNFYRNLPVAVVGGGNSALEEALYLARIVKEVHLIHRRDSFKAARIYVDKAKALPNIIFHTDSVVEDVLVEDMVKGAIIKNTKTGATEKLNVEGIFIYVGMQPNTEFIPQELERDASGFIIAGLEMETNIPGLYVAGDVRVKQYRQIATAMGDGVTAGCSANHYLENE